MLHVIENFAVTQKSFKFRLFSRAHVKFLLVFHCNYVNLVPFLRYSMSNNGMPLKSRLGIIQGY